MDAHRVDAMVVELLLNSVLVEHARDAATENFSAVILPPIMLDALRHCGH